MTTDKIQLTFFDTTLRDGAQTAAVEFSLEQKRIIAAALAQAGFHYIEGGVPGANPIDTALYGTRMDLAKAQLVAFGMTKRTGISASNDPGMAALLNNTASVVCMVTKAWDFHVEQALNTTTPAYLKDVKASIEHAASKNKEVQIDLEHFFDGYKHNRDFALATLETSLEAGAKWITLCDTNGGTTPRGIRIAIQDVLNTIPQAHGHLGIHCHNDLGMATANSLAAIEVGCTLVQGTINGLGERCGNANLLEIIPTLMLKDDYSQDFDCGFDEESLRTHFPALRKLVYKHSGLTARGDDPYYGETAHATKAGIHASAMLKAGTAAYAHIDPASVGQKPRILMSQQGGKSNLKAVLDQMGVAHKGKNTQLEELYREIMEREARGYKYVDAEASLEILARGIMGEFVPPFTLQRAKSVTQILYSGSATQAPSDARLTASFMDKVIDIDATSEKGGPIDAIDAALKKLIDTVMPEEIARDITLVDYKMHNLGEGADSRVRTRFIFEGMINGEHKEWATTGVSKNSTLASIKALKDSYLWVIMRKQWRPSAHLAPQKPIPEGQVWPIQSKFGMGNR